jgi:hypothetical protein
MSNPRVSSERVSARKEIIEGLPFQKARPLEPRLRPWSCSEKCVRLAQKMQVGPCIPVGMQP